MYPNTAPLLAFFQHELRRETGFRFIKEKKGGEAELTILTFVVQSTPTYLDKAVRNQVLIFDLDTLVRQ